MLLWTPEKLRKEGLFSVIFRPGRSRIGTAKARPLSNSSKCSPLMKRETSISGNKSAACVFL